MSLQITDNFDYKGKKANFARDQFATLADMTAFAETSLPEGHVAYCVATGRRYQWKSTNSVDPVLKRWRIMSDLEIAKTLGNSDDIATSQKRTTDELYKRSVFSDVTDIEDVDGGGGKVLDYAGDSKTDAISQRFASKTDKDANVHAEDIGKTIDSVDENIAQLALRKNAQVLTEAEQKQVRTNIGAASAVDIQNVANDVIVPWQGSVSATRLKVHADLRKQCLVIRYYDGKSICIEGYIAVDYSDAAWQNNANWQSIFYKPSSTNAIMQVEDNAAAKAKQS